MFANVDASPATYPECGSAEGEGSRLAVSKALFRTLFAEPLPMAPRFALARFPQRTTVASACGAVEYHGHSLLPGDTGAYAAPDGRGEWFRRNLGQVMVVPFGSGASDDGRDGIVAWLDGEEELRPSVRPCTGDADCAPGVCGDAVCHYLAAPELRAGGTTPLGRTLFYVGEYLRQMVFVDGRPCENDAACGSPGYHCGVDGLCVDPLSHCRPNHIVVLTDGQETSATDPTDFFHPFHQARRFRYGLGCAVDADCGAGATCVVTAAGGSCQPVAPAPSGDAVEGVGPLAPFLAYRPSGGPDRLQRRDGTPVSVTVHVVDVAHNPQNEVVAWLGGGQFVDADLTDPWPVLRAMQLLMESKDPDLQCLRD